MGCGSSRHALDDNNRLLASIVSGSIMAKCFLGWKRFVVKAKFHRLEIAEINARIKAKEEASPNQNPKPAFRVRRAACEDRTAQLSTHHVCSSVCLQSQFIGFRGANNKKVDTGLNKRVVDEDVRAETAQINAKLKANTSQKRGDSKRKLHTGIRRAVSAAKFSAAAKATQFKERVSRSSTSGRTSSSTRMTSADGNEADGQSSGTSKRSLSRRVKSAGNSRMSRFMGSRGASKKDVEV